MTIIDGAGAVITGGGAEIGRALARGLAAAGARVVINDLDPKAAAEVAEQTGGYAVPRRRPGCSPCWDQRPTR